MIHLGTEHASLLQETKCPCTAARSGDNRKAGEPTFQKGATRSRRTFSTSPWRGIMKVFSCNAFRLHVRVALSM